MYVFHGNHFRDVARLTHADYHYVLGVTVIKTLHIHVEHDTSEICKTVRFSGRIHPMYM